MFVLPKRNIVQRAINRSVHRFGIKPFPVRFESSMPQAGSDPDTVFNAIYAANYWESEESKSGGGSELRATARYIPQLVNAIGDLGIRSIFDAPCGDLNWMHLVIDQTGIDYIGGDIAREALDIARARRPDLDLRRFDICTDEFPKADLWHCRDTFFHLSFSDIRRTLERAKAADIEYAAITTHRALFLENLDIKTGGFRLLDLQRPPFNFPRPLRYLRDYPWGQFPQFVAIWRMRDIP
jgi:hypothetical protein